MSEHDEAQETYARLAEGKHELSSVGGDNPAAGQVPPGQQREGEAAMEAAAADPREPARTQETQENPPAPPADKPARTQEGQK